jgi:hypothetical protein
MIPFVQSLTCTGRAHCTICRDREGGRAWRHWIGERFELPRGDGVDFECPYGVEWGADGRATPPRPTASQAVSFVQAMVNGRYVDAATVAERIETCRLCEYRRVDPAGQSWCGACGCRLSEQRHIRNLAAFEENLPAWGCKHPARGSGKGWRR